MGKDTKSIQQTDTNLHSRQVEANKATRDYNAKYDPRNRGLQKGLIGLKCTRNGGVSFKITPYIFRIFGRPVSVKIKATGSRWKDFKHANAKLGFIKTPPGYTWHHLDDYNVATNTFTLELVLSWAHRATTPHSGGCAMYKAATGRRYK